MIAFFIGMMAIGTYFAVRATVMLHALENGQAIEEDLGGPTYG
ncbi:MAG: hypothetical protein V4475_00985 [Pseudomonadota bacterium]